MTLVAVDAQAISPVASCNSAGIGSVTLIADAPVTILSAAPATTPAPASVPYCLVKVLVPPAINIWVGLPTERQLERPPAIRGRRRLCR